MINHPNRKRASRAKVATSPTHSHDHDYSALLAGVRASFEVASKDSAKLFMTDADGLNEVYLGSLPSERQHHNCSACRRFIERYGSLVTITEIGETVPAMWGPEAVPEFYQSTFAALHARVKKARVTAPFLAKETMWGTPTTGSWSHMAVTPAGDVVYRERALTAGQAMAAAKENFRTVASALAEFTAPMLDEAIRMLQTDNLARSEKFLAPVKWLRALHDRPKGRLGENILWRAIATAPEGYCHPKASVIGPLLDDIAAGLPFAEIKAKFDAKMHPLMYQRPQAAPTAGNIAASEALVAKLGIAPSLERRFARLDECQTIWRPVERAKPSAPTEGIFGHLKPKDASTVRPVELPSSTMTWDKFARTVLPTAERITIDVPSRGRFIALTTAVHVDAPPIMKWDREDERNPVAWYLYHNGSQAEQWGLATVATEITGIVPPPTLWGSKPMPFMGDGAVLVIKGAVDKRDAGNALFPECLREELHGARSTIEAYSRSAVIAGREQASACGYHIGKSAADCCLRVLASGSWTSYRIDRWD